MKKGKPVNVENQTAQQSPTMPDGYHVPVLLQETIEGMMIKPDAVYVDCTFGGGGHSQAILSRLSKKGRLFCFDQDGDAEKNLPDDDRITFIAQNFRHLQRFLRLHEIDQVDGIMADLGVSSHQFDEAERGFSIRYNAALDMRMDQRQEITASKIVATYTEQQLHKLFEQYGEVSNAKTLARTIVQIRSTSSMQTIDGFKNAIRSVVKGNPNKYFAQVFQALRIEVNDELGALKDLLQQTPKLLKPGGRLAIITFHSLEDRLVKNFFKRGLFDEPVDENPFINTEETKELKVITKKPVIASNEEIKRNGRSRSAKLRVAEKI